MTDIIERIRLRCVCDDCWTWKGAQTRGLPIVAMRDETGRRTNVSARRVVWEAHKGKALGDDDRVMPSCENGLCLNPAHLMKVSRSYVNSKMAQSADMRAKKARAARTRWNRDAKLSMEKARYIRASDKTQVQLAAELGVAQTLISRVRQGQLWRETNLFAGLMASNDSSRRAA